MAKTKFKKTCDIALKFSIQQIYIESTLYHLFPINHTRQLFAELQIATPSLITRCWLVPKLCKDHFLQETQTRNNELMSNENGNGHHHGQEGDEEYRELLTDPEFAAQFNQLVALAEAKGLDQDEIGYGLIAATAEHMLARGEPECCVMQVLMDYTASFYGWWHDGLSEDAKDEEEN